MFIHVTMPNSTLCASKQDLALLRPLNSKCPIQEHPNTKCDIAGQYQCLGILGIGANAIRRSSMSTSKHSVKDSIKQYICSFRKLNSNASALLKLWSGVEACRQAGYTIFINPAASVKSITAHRSISLISDRYRGGSAFLKLRNEPIQ